MNPAIMALYGDLGAGELTPGTFSILFPTAFDKAVKAIKAYLNSTYRIYPSTDELRKLLASYIELARKRREPYLQAKYEIWLKDLIAAGNDNIYSGRFLHAMRVLSQTGEVQAIVYQPWTYTADDDTWIEKFTKEIKTGTRILYIALVGVVALAVWAWIAPRRGRAASPSRAPAGGKA